MVVFCNGLVNPFGPLHEYEAPPPEVRERVCPAQTGLVLLAVAIGALLTVTTKAAVPEHPPEVFTITEYVPEFAVVTLGIEGL